MLRGLQFGSGARLSETEVQCKVIFTEGKRNKLLGYTLPRKEEKKARKKHQSTERDIAMKIMKDWFQVIHSW